MVFVNILKYTLGILLAIAILAGGGFATALYVINRTSMPPAKPIFANDSPAVRGEDPKVTAAKAAKAASAIQAKAKASAKPTPKPKPSAKSLPPGAYHARITWKQGLILRGEPKQEAERIGGVGFNSRVIVLQESQDKVWQKIRLEGGDEKEAGKQEGWVKAGNTQKVDENDSQQTEQKKEDQ